MGIQAGQPAKDFTSKYLFGNAVALADYKGKKRILREIYTGNTVWNPPELDLSRALLDYRSTHNISVLKPVGIGLAAFRS